MVHLLEGVVDDGTARSLRTVYGLNNAIGGKTGTTQGNADGWFIAITPQLVSGAWVGGIYPEISFQETRLGQGATMALPIFAKFYGRLSADQGYKPITKAEFPVISEEWKNELDCDPFKEDFRLFDWLFNKEDKGEKLSADKKKEGEEGFFRKIGDIFKKKNKKEKQD